MKICLKCLIEKPTTDFRHSQGNIDGLNNYCKQCAKVHPKIELIWLGNKVCAGCGADLPRTEYNHMKNPPIKLQSACIKCMGKRLRLRYHSNHEQSREYIRANRKKNYHKNPKIHYWGNWPESERKNHYRQMAKEGSKRQSEKNIREITDSYVIHVLFKVNGFKMADVRKIPHIQEIIETKRAIIQLNRERKNLNTINIS